MPELRDVSWRENLVEDDERVLDLLASVRRIAVLGIKPEFRSPKPAFTVPEYLQREGYEIVPVPVYYPTVTAILGQPVHRTLAAIPGDVDLVDVFRLSRDIPPHVPDILAKRPRAVWFQLGIREDRAAREIAEAGILVVQDRCTAIEHRRLRARSQTGGMRRGLAANAAGALDPSRAGAPEGKSPR